MSKSESAISEYCSEKLMKLRQSVPLCLEQRRCSSANKGVGRAFSEAGKYTTGDHGRRLADQSHLVSSYSIHACQFCNLRPCHHYRYTFADISLCRGDSNSPQRIFPSRHILAIGTVHRASRNCIRHARIFSKFRDLVSISLCVPEPLRF